MLAKSVWIDCNHLRSANDVRVAINRLDKDKMPYFVHKWTRKTAKYRNEDLLFPTKLNTFGVELSKISARPFIGIGGTRSPTVETFLYVNRLCRLLAMHGIVVISGCVPGVDLAAHMGAVDIDGGATVAVMANPADLQSAGHGFHAGALDASITKTGCFVSEYDVFEDQNSAIYLERLLQRDRIISGLSRIFFAFECNIDSATFDTAVRAALQGASVFIVHPHLNSIRRGTYTLAEKIGLFTDDVSEFRVDSKIDSLVDAVLLKLQRELH